ncbi:hypothetical protein ACHAW6_004728 [Cyclotella cf. meneghiniana]
MNLGMSTTTLNEEEKDSSFWEASVSNLPHHLILNFPLDATSFLNILRWWPSGEKIECPPRVQVYMFAWGDEVRTAAEVASNMVADGLLLEGGTRQAHIGCNVMAREVRDAAPEKLVICVSFSVTQILL